VNKGKILEKAFANDWIETSPANKEMEAVWNEQNLISTDWLLLYQKLFADCKESTWQPEIGPNQPFGSAKKYHFSDLVDVGLIHKLLFQCYAITGIPNALLDVDNNILSAIGWQDICTQFHRACPYTENRCRQSDSYIFNNLHNGTYVGYQCLNGIG